MGDAGLTWSNYSTGLPNRPVNCILYQEASNDGLYVGTDVGIYFIDNAAASWQPFFTGLPNVDVEEMEIAYSIGKIRAATNGRGLWESDLAVPQPTTLTWVGINMIYQVITYNLFISITKINFNTYYYSRSIGVI